MAHDKATVLPERADNIISLRALGKMLEEIIGAYAMSLGQGQ